MTIRTASEALVIANGTRVNVEGMCQAVTRGYYLAPSAGDRDGDGDADAYDGWLSEPSWARHLGDRNPPAGYPVSFRGGSKGHGHRAISLGGGKVRSTDFDGLTKRYRAGVLGNGTIAEVEAAMGVTYLGWSKTIDGESIPQDAPTPAKEESVAESKEPYAHRHVVADWRNNRQVSMPDVSDVQRLEKEPYAHAAWVLHKEVVEAMEKYLTATGGA